MLRGRGRLLMFADADGATKFSDIQKLEESLQKQTSQKKLEVLYDWPWAQYNCL